MDILKGLDDVPSNGKKICALCGNIIDESSDSGWEVFVDGGKFTQPICVWCEAEGETISEKKEDDEETALFVG